jgi:hypothetical protein
MGISYDDALRGVYRLQFGGFGRNQTHPIFVLSESLFSHTYISRASSDRVQQESAGLRAILNGAFNR